MPVYRATASRVLCAAVWGLTLVCLRAMAGSPFEAYLSSSLEKIYADGRNLRRTRNDVVSLQAAKDEAESFQVTLISKLPHSQTISVAVEPFPASIQWEWFRVGYVQTAPPSYPTEHVGLWPDPLFLAVISSCAATSSRRCGSM